jgi:hypothetical protein
MHLQHLIDIPAIGSDGFKRQVQLIGNFLIAISLVEIF